MRRYWEIDQTFAQPSESLLKKNLKESVKKQKEKGNKLEPVVISGRAIAKSWWGKAWCDNLEHYADFASRLERGKRYVRTGTVIDLKIQKGKIIARVQGTRKTPYRVEIRISPLTEQKCEAILDRCGKITIGRNFLLCIVHTKHLTAKRYYSSAYLSIILDIPLRLVRRMKYIQRNCKS